MKANVVEYARVGVAMTLCMQRTRLSSLSGMVREMTITEPTLVPTHSVVEGVAFFVMKVLAKAIH